MSDPRHNSEQQRATELYRVISELAFVQVYSARVEPDGTLTPERATDAWLRAIGFTLEEIMTLGGWEILIHPDDLPIARQHLQTHLTGQPDIAEYRVVTKSGEVLWVRDYGHPVWDDAQGRVVRIYGAVQDITEHKQAETALRESQALYRTLLEASPDSITVTDLEGKITEVSQHAVQMHGCTHAEELLEKTAFDLIAPEDHARAAENLRKTLHEGFVKNAEYTLLRQDGSRFIGELNAALIRDAAGDPKAFIATVRDISERRRTEEQLHLLSSAIAQSSEGIAISDLEGNLLFVNKAFAAVHGYTPDELIGEHLSIFHTPEQMPAVDAANQQILQTGGFNGEIWHARRDGSVFPTMMNNSLLRDEAGNPSGMIGTLRDITAHKQAEAALRESEEKYRDLVENISDVIYLVSKDGLVTYISPAIESFLGYHPSELIGRHFRAFVHQPDIQRLAENFQRVLSGQIAANEYQIIAKSGKIHWARTSSRPILEEDRVVGVRGVLADITARKQAEESLLEYTQRLEALREIDQAILEAQSPEEIAQAALHRIRQLVPCQRADVILVDWDTNEAVVFAIQSEGETRLTQGTRIPLAPFTDIVEDVHQGKLDFIEVFMSRSEPGSAEQALQAEGLRSYVNIPLLTQGELIGSLNLGSASRDAFAPQHIEIAREVADSLATAIQNARLLEAERRHSTELEALHQAGLHLTSRLELQPVLQAILDHALRLVAADDVHIFLYDGQTLTFGAVLWADGRREQPYEPRPKGLTYAVAHSGERLVIPNVDEHPLFQDWPWGGAIVGLPLRFGERVVGVMNIALDRVHHFDEGELRVLELLADQAAIAIENAQLHEQVRRHADELEQRVAERTAELERSVKLMAGREGRMAELKHAIRQLRQQIEAAGLSPVADDPLATWRVEGKPGN